MGELWCTHNLFVDFSDRKQDIPWVRTDPQFRLNILKLAHVYEKSVFLMFMKNLFFSGVYKKLIFLMFMKNKFFSCLWKSVFLMCMKIIFSPIISYQLYLPLYIISHFTIRVFFFFFSNGAFRVFLYCFFFLLMIYRKKIN